MSAKEHEPVLTGATGKESVADAISWIARGHDLVPGADVHAVLRSLVALGSGGEAAQEATQRLTRIAAASKLDSGKVLFGLDEVNWPARFRRALDVLAWRSPDHTLAGLTADSVAAAQRDDRFVIRTLCAVAGIRTVVGLVSDRSGPLRGVRPIEKCSLAGE